MAHIEKDAALRSEVTLDPLLRVNTKKPTRVGILPENILHASIDSVF